MIEDFEGCVEDNGASSTSKIKFSSAAEVEVGGGWRGRKEVIECKGRRRSGTPGSVNRIVIGRKRMLACSVGLEVDGPMPKSTCTESSVSMLSTEK